MDTGRSQVGRQEFGGDANASSLAPSRGHPRPRSRTQPEARSYQLRARRTGGISVGRLKRLLLGEGMRPACRPGTDAFVDVLCQPGDISIVGARRSPSVDPEPQSGRRRQALRRQRRAAARCGVRTGFGDQQDCVSWFRTALRCAASASLGARRERPPTPRKQGSARARQVHRDSRIFFAGVPRGTPAFRLSC